MNLIILNEFFIAFVIAAVLSAVFTWAARRRGRRTGFFWFFLIVLVATWAGGVWIQPLEATSKGVRWWPFIIVGLPFAILVAVFGQRNPPEGRQETLEKLDEMASEKTLEKITYSILKLIFWLVFIIMVVAILLRYLTRI